MLGEIPRNQPSEILRTAANHGDLVLKGFFHCDAHYLVFSLRPCSRFTACRRPEGHF
jgi:hypothetical protein